MSLLPRQGKQGPAALRNLSDLEKLIRPNAVVSIGYDESGGIMFGLVDSVRRNRSMGDTTNYGLTLTGSDFGKALARDHIVKASLTIQSTLKVITQVAAVTGPQHSLIEALPGLWGPQGRTTTPTFTGKGVQDVVDWLLETAPSLSVPLLAGQGGTGRPGEFINTEGTISTWNDGRIWNDGPQTYQGTVWDFMRRILDEDFYEVWLDTTPAAAVRAQNVLAGISPTDIPRIDLIIRPKPFDEPAMMFLPTGDSTGLDWPSLQTRIDGFPNHEIPLASIIQEDLGFTDEDVYSYFLVTTAHALLGNPDGLKEGLYYPGIDTFALSKTGLRSYEGTLSLLAADVVAKTKGDVDYDGDVGIEVVQFRNRLMNWYRANEYMTAGTITVPGKDRYRVGDPVLIPEMQPARGQDPGMRFYCVGTTHKWSATGLYSCELRLMRGHNTSVITQFKQEIAADVRRYPGADPAHLATADR
tara:strand:- start:10661 stop:12070 length:1410 start_codon:yes stop_codon:yes gene_type:complete